METVLDTNCIIFLSEAVVPNYNPNLDDKYLSEQRVAMLRILLYCDNSLWQTPTTVKELVKLKDDSKYKNVFNVCCVAMSTLHCDSFKDRDRIFEDVTKCHKGENDCKIFVEAVLCKMNILLTYDKKFIKHFENNMYNLKLDTPSNYWLKLNIEKGSKPKIIPNKSNPLHYNTFWKW